MKPLVSVIIPVFNAGVYLRPALQSVLVQSHREIEILLIDDGSTDGCMESVKDLLVDPRIVCVVQPNAGKPSVMNKAIALARGEFYVVNDADDLSSSDRIVKQAAFLRENPDAAGVFCGYDLILDGRHCAPTVRAKTREQCAFDIAEFRMPGHDPTAMYRMSMVRDIPLAADLPVVEGIDYVLRVGERWPLCVLGEKLYSYRIHFASLTRSDPSRRDELLRRALRRACERRGIDFESRFPVRPPFRWKNRDRDNNIAASFIESVCEQREAGELVSAIMTGLQCASLHRLDPHYYKALAYALAPRGFVKRVRTWAAERRSRTEASQIGR